MASDWDPAQTYDRLDRLFVAVNARLKEGWWASVDGAEIWVNAEWVANRIGHANPNYQDRTRCEVRAR